MKTLSDVDEFKDSIAIPMPLSLLLGEFVLPILLVIRKDQSLSLLHIVINQVDLLLLFLAHAQDAARPQVYLPAYYLHELVCVEASKLVIKLLYMKYFGDSCWIYVVIYYLLSHHFRLLEQTVLLIVIEDRCHYGLMKFVAVLLELSKEPCPSVKGIDIAEKGSKEQRTPVLLTILIIVEGRFQPLVILILALLRVTQSILHLLHVKVPKERIQTSHVGTVLDCF